MYFLLQISFIYKRLNFSNENRILSKDREIQNLNNKFKIQVFL